MGYIPTTLVPYHDWGPPPAAPAADPTAEQHAAQQFGSAPTTTWSYFEATIAEPPLAAPAADATAEQNAARQYGELPAPGIPAGPSASA